MNPLPQLRTVRDGRTQTPITPSAPLSKPVEHPKLPSAAQQLLGEAIRAGLLTSAEVAKFLADVGDRIPQLSSRDRSATALVQLGFLTPYQKLRLVSGQTHGMLLGNYRVLDRLGGGTVGTVFTAIHPFLKRKVAIKVLTFEGAGQSIAVERFLDEARILAKLDHPHVVGVLDAGTTAAEGRDESLWYTVLELVDGGDVENFVYEHGAQPLPQACEWGRQIALGLRAIHDAGIVHRDLKPGKLLLTAARAIKIADFGLARQPTSVRTPCRTLLGSLEFLAPEQLQDPTTVGPPADIYSLGATLFWTLTGKLPYPEGLTLTGLTDFIVGGSPKRIKEIRSGLPEGLDGLIARMLNLNPAHRPTAAEVVDVLTPWSSLSNNPELESVAEDTPSTLVLQLERTIVTKTARTAEAHTALIAALALLASKRPGESLGHQMRLSAYVHRLARVLGNSPRWVGLADPAAQDELGAMTALHDLGLIDIPEAILNVEVGSRTPSEEHTYRSHPERGDAVLTAIAERFGAGMPFLRTLRSIARHHHECWDGTGFPDKLAGENITLAARIVAIADGYDEMRCEGRAHVEAMHHLDKKSGTLYDPTLLQQLRTCHTDWDEIFSVIADSGQSELIGLHAAV